MSAADLYEVLELIGRGSFGIIRKVRRRSDGKILVRKEISYHKMSQKEKEQLTAEFGILSQLKHPNIVEYIQRDHLKSDATLHLYMEYCGNGDLTGVIKKCQRQGTMIPEKLVWNFVVQIALALYRCHNGVDPPEIGEMWWRESTKPPALTATGTKPVKILHRDLKPENIFLGEDNDVKLGDFGLSKALDPGINLTSTYVGTPYYMSPEIVSDLPYTHKSDIWSLGCIIYELCKLSPPFNAKTQWSLIDKIKQGSFQPISTKYSEELKNLIDWCLKVDPLRRPDTADLLELDVFRVLRREQQVVAMNREIQSHFKVLKAKEQALLMREKDLERLFEEHVNNARQELDTQLRNQWEVRAQETINKQVEAQLHERIEAEISTRLQVEVARHIKDLDLVPRATFHDSNPQDYGSSGTSSNNSFPSSGSPPRLQFNHILLPDSPADITMGSPNMGCPATRHNVFSEDPPRMPLQMLPPNKPALQLHQSVPDAVPQHPPTTPCRTKSAPMHFKFCNEMEPEGDSRLRRPLAFGNGPALGQIPHARQGLQRAGTTGNLIMPSHHWQQEFGMGGRADSMDDFAMVKTTTGVRPPLRMSLVEISKINRTLGPAPVWDRDGEDCPSPFRHDVLKIDDGFSD